MAWLPDIEPIQKAGERMDPDKYPTMLQDVIDAQFDALHQDIARCLGEIAKTHGVPNSAFSDISRDIVVTQENVRWWLDQVVKGITVPAKHAQRMNPSKRMTTPEVELQAHLDKYPSEYKTVKACYAEAERIFGLTRQQIERRARNGSNLRLPKGRRGRPTGSKTKKK